ncbi:MAG: OmpA family protein [Deltaproteobacteria bacterium]|nr:OmpA family protein [Deltaproteobacteria bacterium]
MNKILITLLSLFIWQLAYAGDLKFETTSEGITKALIKQKTEQKIKTRSIKGTNTIKTRSIRVVSKDQGKIVEKTITAPESQVSQGVNLKIEFDYDSYSICPESFQLLDELGKALVSEQLKGSPIIIIGHTDSDGEDAYNLKLSLNRALAVKSYLKSSFPIFHSLLKVLGYGEGLPLVSNDNEENKQINRRVEISTLQ